MTKIARAKEREREEVRARARVKAKVEASAARWAREATKATKAERTRAETASKQEEETMTEKNNEKVTMDNFDRWADEIRVAADLRMLSIRVKRTGKDYAEVEVFEKMPKGSEVSERTYGFFLFRGMSSDYMEVMFSRSYNVFGRSLAFSSMRDGIPVLAIRNIMKEMEASNAPPVRTISLRYKAKRQVERVARRIGTALDIRKAR